MAIAPVRLLLAAAAAAVLSTVTTAQNSKPCEETAQLLNSACRKSAQADYAVAKAKCINIADAAARAQCLDAADADRRETLDLCREQLQGRRDACRVLGGNPYDPDFKPANFDDPRDPSNPNPYFPLDVGNHWEYRGGVELNTIDVVNETKSIEGVTCIVFRDLVYRDGNLAEATDDWFAPAKDGSTWYFGEEVKDYQTFDGDAPHRPELVDIAGSFKAGCDHDKPGVIFLASPSKGAVYLEEFSLGNAEDVTEILSTTYAFGNDAELDQFVPRALAERLCASGDCVVTKNYSLVEPGVFARKYYARGIGVFLEIELPKGDFTQLVNCNFDARCVGLPAADQRR